MSDYITLERLSKEVPFINLAITTKEVDAKNINDLRKTFTNNEFNLKNLTSNIQIHSDIVNIINEKDINTRREGDSLITNITNVPLLTFTADCVPVAFIDKKRQSIGVAHAGWRGTYSEISKNTIESLKDTYNSKPEDIICIIGPAIGECCYEVSQELYEQFDDKFNLELNSLGKIVKENSFQKYYLNLESINEYSLITAGVKKENIIKLSMCTNCNQDKLHSYRAHKATEKRIGLLVEIKNESQWKNERFNDFYTSYNFLKNHEMCKSKKTINGEISDSEHNFFESCLDVEVVKVNPLTSILEYETDKLHLNTKTEVWLEFGGAYLNLEESENVIFQHDTYLDCGADTFEEAIIILANLVDEHYNDDGTLKLKQKDA